MLPLSPKLSQHSEDFIDDAHLEKLAGGAGWSTWRACAT